MGGAGVVLGGSCFDFEACDPLVPEDEEDPELVEMGVADPPSVVEPGAVDVCVGVLCGVALRCTVAGADTTILSAGADLGPVEPD